MIYCFLQSDKLERLRERMIKVRELFRDTDSTEFVIVTIPTVMAVSESSRLRASLQKENVPVKRLIVNQILPPSASDCKFCAMKRRDQMRAFEMIQNDPELSSLTLIQAPLVDVEIRGVPALKFLGDIIWK
ncbi:ATPase GET3B-like [Manihot esculenta]|nr:ATPase GET3B-like [Manihot esculenta]